MKRRFKGYSYRKDKGKYQGRVRFRGKNYSSPYFDTPEAAQAWYDDKSLALYGYDRTHDLDVEDILPPEDIDLFAHEKESKYHWK